MGRMQMTETVVNKRITLRDVDIQPMPASVPIFAIDEVGPGKYLSINFELTLENSELIDSNFGQIPVSFTVGDGNLLPGFEQAMFGMHAGESKEFLLPPVEAFGMVNEDNIQRFPCYQFPPDLTLSKGLMINFADKASNKQAGVIKHFDSTFVEVDFNHPLAGRSIRFKVFIHSVQVLPTSKAE